MYDRKLKHIIQLAKVTICCLGFFVCTNLALAQKADTTKVAIIKRTPEVDKVILLGIDTTQKMFFQTQDAAALLEANSNTYVKNYGLSSLSTLSIRGSSVAQTNVLWNNIPIQNTMLGLTDLSTLPNFLFDEMVVYPSGFNQKGKEQSIAGRLELNAANNFSDSLAWQSKLLYGYESFQNSMFGAKLGMTSKKLHAQIKYYNRQGQNCYSFYNTYRQGLDTIEHSYAIQKQLLANIGYKPNEHHLLNFHFWRINNFREIAPSAFEENVQRAEENKVTRFGLQHEYSNLRFVLRTAAGYTADSFRYEDDQIKLKTLANVQNLPLNSAATFFINDKSDVGIAYNQVLSFYDQKNLSENLQQYGVQLFYNHSNIWEGLGLNTFVKKQYASIGKNPITYGFRISYPFGIKHLVYGSYNTNYRIPTLNELYYFPGGNENLKPESAKNIELGGKLLFDKNNWSIENNLTLYLRKVDDWILWSGSAIFFPDNIAEVWSRGFENQLSLKYKSDSWQFRNDWSLAINKATSEKPYFVNDQSVGKQIPYVPLTSWRNNVYVGYQNFSAQLNYSYTGYRFLTRDETEYVEPYSLWNLFFAYKLTYKKNDLQLQVKFNNLLDTNYESLRGRIMPGQNFAISIILEGSY